MLKFKNYIDNLPLKELKKLKEELDQTYYNPQDGEESKYTDEQYDYIKDRLFERQPKTKKTVGVTLRESDNRVELPFWMGSADKITPEEPEKLVRWKIKNRGKGYVITEKLDGVSCLLTVLDGDIKLYTRGDGVIGADISYLQKYFSLPKLDKNINVRGELIMKKSKFEKYKSQYRNPRNMVAGLVGSKTFKPALKDVEFVAYEIVKDSMYNQERQLEELREMGFQTTDSLKLTDITIEKLKQLYIEFKNSSEYELDGIIVQHNSSYERNISGNPEYMFAFKMLLEDAIHTTVVKDIEWNISKWGQLKPVVLIEPVILNEITMTRVTAHNAKYVEENGLGKGAVIRITRSKDVIPYIVDVISRADTTSFPDVAYKWDKNHVNIYVVEYQGNTICIKIISNFFSGLNIKHISEKTVEKLMENGLDNIIKIISANKDRLLKIQGIEEKGAERIYSNIRNGLTNVRMSKVIAVSGIFGFGIGEKRVELLFNKIPEILEIEGEQLRDKILKLEGFSNILATPILMNIKYAKMFIKKISPYVTFKKTIEKSKQLDGNIYVFTGFRDKDLEERIKNMGGDVKNTISGKTTCLIIKDDSEKSSSKYQKAIEKGITIYSKTQFLDFLNNK